MVAVYDHGHDRGLHYLVMEFVEGAYHSRKKSKRLGSVACLARCQDVLLQIARASSSIARQQDEIHRDVKPANILVTEDGIAKLADLGWGQTGRSSWRRINAMTMQGMMMGSPAYCAPEQARDASTAGHAADVYSLGATFFHAITGQAPFRFGKNARDVVRMVLNEEPDAHRYRPRYPRWH